MSEADNVFAAFLRRLEAGEDPDFAELCAQHPELALELARLWETHRTTRASPVPPSYFFRELRRAEPSPAARVHAGMSIGEYRLIAKIAGGGQGEVWEAEHRRLRRHVALKFILPERVSTRARELFLREARAGGRLLHPGIVTVFDQGTDEGHAWIAMELVEGGCTLRDAIDGLNRKRLPREYYRGAAQLGVQLADALHAAHEAGVIHRDIKPRNILVTPDDRVKITDFGLAKIADEEALSRTGDFMGTYSYMSPEQVAARRAGIDHRTDIFSLGVVLYELFSGRQPFEGLTTHEIADKILTSRPPDLKEIDPRVPRDLQVICFKALEKARRDRFQSMAELAAELRRFLAGEPIVTIPPSRAQRAARWIRRHPVVQAEALTLAGCGVLLYLGTRPEPRPPFTGDRYEQLIVTDSPAHDQYPTFVANRHVVFERRERELDPPRLWKVDLRSDLSARPWSPAGEDCGRPAASPDGRWLGFETHAPESDATRILVRRLDSGEVPLPWPTEDAVRIDPAEGSALGLAWSPDSRSLAYTVLSPEARSLFLHDMLEAPRDDREIFRMARRDAWDFEPFQVCFSPGGDRILITDRDQHHLVRFSEEDVLVETTQLDCGTSRSPAWLADDSFLVARSHTWEASARLYHWAGSEGSRVHALETHLIGGVSSLAVNPDRSILAYVTRVGTSTAFLATAGDEAPTALSLRYPPAHVAWTPDGRILYSGDTGRGTRLNLYDPESQSDIPLHVSLSFLDTEDPYQLDQVAFSENGERLVFRAKYDPPDGACNARQWIVIADWPLGDEEPSSIAMQDRVIRFPHVSDSGSRLVWCEQREGSWRVVGAELANGHVTSDVELLENVYWPARLSGDGVWIACEAPGEGGKQIRVVSWEGEELPGGEGLLGAERPLWLSRAPTEAARLAYLASSPTRPDLLLIESLSVEDPGGAEALATFPPLDEETTGNNSTPFFVHYDPRTFRAVYVIHHREGGNLWLIRDKEEDWNP